MLALFLKEEIPSVTRTPNSMKPVSRGEEPPETAAPPSVHVRELWPLLPHCEHVRDISTVHAINIGI